MMVCSDRPLFSIIFTMQTKVTAQLFVPGERVKIPLLEVIKVCSTGHYFSTFIIVLNTVVVRPRIAISIKETRKLVASAMKPIMGGPNKNPR